MTFATYAPIFAFVAMMSFRGLRRFRRREITARLLEVLSAAMNRGLSVAPVVERATVVARGREKIALQRVHMALQRGETLSAALAAGGPAVADRTVTASLAAAERGPGAPALLAALVRRDEAAARYEYAFGITMLYPIVLGIVGSLLVAIRNPIRQLINPHAWELAQSGKFGFSVFLWTLAVIVLVRWLARRGRWWPGSVDADAARWLHASAPLIEAGRPLHEALRVAAPACRPRSRERAVREVAARIERGDSVLEASQALPAAPIVQARLGTALRREPASAAAAIRALGDECAMRAQRSGQARLRWLQPTLLLILGALIALHYGAIFEYWIDSQQEVLW